MAAEGHVSSEPSLGGQEQVSTVPSATSGATADENADRAGGKRAQAGDDVTADLSLSGAAAQIAGVAGGAPFSPEPLAAL